MNITKLKCSIPLVNQTLEDLKNAGKFNKECIVLWLGHRTKEFIEITEVLQPIHHAKADMFHIPPGSMREIMEYLRNSRLMIAAQVHSHPEQAFHSYADDKWAIIRHVGAISIVLPYFAKNTSKETFLNDAATYALTEKNQWEQVPNQIVEII